MSPRDDIAYEQSVALKFGVPKATWLNYKRARQRFGCKNPSGDLFRTHRISPNTTFKWLHSDYSACVCAVWSKAGEVCKTVPAYMRTPDMFYPIMLEVFGVSKEDLLRDIRDVAISRTRHVLMWVMYAQGIDIASVCRAVSKDYSVVAYTLRNHKPQFEEFIGVSGRKDNHNGRLTSYGQKNRDVPPRLYPYAGFDSSEAQA